MRKGYQLMVFGVKLSSEEPLGTVEISNPSMMDLRHAIAVNSEISQRQECLSICPRARTQIVVRKFQMVLVASNDKIYGVCGRESYEGGHFHRIGTFELGDDTLQDIEYDSTMVLNRSTPSEIRALYRLYSTTLDKEIAESEKSSQAMAKSHFFLPVVQRLKAGRTKVVTISNVREKEDSEISIPQRVEELDILGSFVQSSRTLEVFGPYNDWARDCLAPIRAEAAFSLLLAEKRTDDLALYLMRLYEAKIITDEGVQVMTDLLAVRSSSALLAFGSHRVCVC